MVKKKLKTYILDNSEFLVYPLAYEVITFATKCTQDTI